MISDEYSLEDLKSCFTGLIPMVLATSSASGTPNVTYLSRAHPAGDQRIAVSNQFLSKSKRNLIENPHASMLLIDGNTHDEFRLTVVFERTERHGPVFDRLRDDLSVIAALTGMEKVFKLQAADIYRVTRIEKLNAHSPLVQDRASIEAKSEPAPLAELCARISRCGDLDTLVEVTVDGLASLLGYEHSMLSLLDEDGQTLFTIASRGYEAEGIGSEVRVGEGIAGMAASQCAPIRAGNLRQMTKYARAVRKEFEESGSIEPGRVIPLPGLPDAGSKLAVPALALGQLVGVLSVESRDGDRFSEADASMLTVIASLVASSVETLRREVKDTGAITVDAAPALKPVQAATCVRYFPVDGSTFVDGDYLIRGVAGRILWSLLQQHVAEGRIEFTNREVRLDPSLDMPDFRDNFESRLILLKRRLEERRSPVQIVRTGRGKFRLDTTATFELEEVDTALP